MGLDSQASEQIEKQIDTISVVSHERAILANILNEPDLIYEAQLSLDSSDFFNHVNKNIYSVMLEIAEGKYENVNKISSFVILMLSNIGNLDVGGEEYLKTLEVSRVQRENFYFSVDRVKFASIRRRTAYESLNVLDECINNSDGKIDDFTNKQETRFVDIVLNSKGVDRVVQIGEDIDEDLKTYEENEGDIEGYSTGFPELDYEIGGIVDGEVTVVCAFAKTGKSSLLVNVAKHLTADAKEPVPVLYIDTEMNTKKQRSRLLSIFSKVPEKIIRRGLYVTDPQMKANVAIAKELIKKIPFYHVHLTEFTMDNIVNLVRKYQKQKGIKVLIFDYIKMPDNADGKFQEWQELGRIVSTLKNRIASRMGIGVITAGQLNRDGDVGGSLRIIQYCDNLLFLKNKTDEQILEDGKDNGNQILELAYARNGGDYLGWINYQRKILTMKEMKNIRIKIGN